jgi:Ca2+-binding RTX toxin-like protein
MLVRGSFASFSGLRLSQPERDWSHFSARDGGGPILRLDGGGAEESTGAGDTIPGNTGSTATLAIGGSVNGYVNFVGDDDWYRVELVAGQSYVFTLTGSGGTPLADPYLELRSSGGALIAIDDDAGPGVNSLLRFTPTQSGTYYINARAYEGAGVSNTGGYTLTAAIGAAQNPLDTIDLHFQMPDNTIAIYFATAGQSFQGDTASRNWTQAEINAVFAALATFSAVTPLVFTQTFSSAAADWILTIDNDIGANVLGHFFVGYPGYGAFDGDVAGWSQGLIPGGSSFFTLIHEFGHGLGLAHPHDNGAVNYGVNNSEIMQGVIDPFNSYGTYSLNQAVFTVMTYNDGWPLGFLGPATTTTGNAATPMALDIALLQQLYGINPTTNNGDTSYNLMSLSSYQAIWDTGGADTIFFSGASAAVIDLRAATLLNEVGGGGYVSYVSGVNGGYTIANGVVIENATGGSGNDTLVGNGAANVLDGGAGADSMTGGAGDDTYVVDNVGDLVTEAPDEGVDTVLSSISYTLGANVENLTLTGSANINGTGNGLNNVLTGNSGNNTLSGGAGNDYLIGGAGNDVLDGGAGADVMYGGAGDDTYMVDDVGDVTGDGGGGTDTVIATVTRSLGGGLENLILAGSANINGSGNGLANTITGNSGDNALAGNAGDDTLLGGAGSDTLSGGAGNDLLDGGEGDDIMYGGPGDDVFIVDSAGDITGDAAGGVDTVMSSVTRTLASGLENLILTGAADINGTGNSLANTIIGNSGSNTLSGGAGADILDGGAGDDIMYGGEGNDTFYVDSVGDITGESASANGGVDTVIASVTRSLGSYIENLVLTGSADIDGTGNGLANTITGNSGANVLSGNDGDDTLIGGAGADTLIGGAGTDTANYAASAAAVTVDLGAGTGSGGDAEGDTLSGIENVTGSAFADVLTGDAGANLLSGGAGNDILDGGAGDDIMYGGAGDDIFIVDSVGDITGDGAGGIDTVMSSVSRTLGGNLENLVLTGTDAIDGTGNGLDNVITGNAAANTLTGGAGADAFVFNTALGAGNIDVIADFAPGQDAIWLDPAIFALAAGPLDAGAFHIGAAATDAAHRIIYDDATGALYYDPDGDGAGAAVQFAALTPGLVLTSSDFIVMGA